MHDSLGVSPAPEKNADVASNLNGIKFYNHMSCELCLFRLKSNCASCRFSIDIIVTHNKVNIEFGLLT